MGIFGDLNTPESNPLEPPVEQLVELSFKPQMTIPVQGGTALSVIKGVRDLPTALVNLRAEVKTGFSDGTAGEGVKVAFFINGHRLKDV